MSDTTIATTSTTAEAPRKTARVIDVSGLKAAADKVDPRNLSTQRKVELIAVALVPLGVSIILAGWRGAASTILLPEQVPYLISGGILGGAIAVGGGLLYVGSWIARLAAQNREQTEALRNSLEALRDDLRALPVGGGGDTAAAVPADAFVATPSGSMYHRADCQVVANRDNIRTLKDKDLAKMKPCGMCAPD